MLPGMTAPVERGGSARASAASAREPLSVVVGEEEFLVERAVSEVIRAVRAEAGDVEVADATASVLTPGELYALLSPTLFGGARVLVVRGAHELPKDMAGAFVAAVTAAEDVTVVVTLEGGTRGKGVVDALVAGGAALVRCDAVTSASARADFVLGEARAAGGRMTPSAAAALVASVGSDLRELATATSQLVADAGGSVDESVVARYHRGRADASGFAVADRAMDGDAAGALELLRWALDTGLPPVLVTSSLAANLRLVAKVAAEGRTPAARIARVVGQPAWKVERAMRWARRWSAPAIAAAVQAVAAADGEVKGGAVDAGYAVERAVLAVTAARSGEAGGVAQR